MTKLRHRSRLSLFSLRKQCKINKQTNPIQRQKHHAKTQAKTKCNPKFSTGSPLTLPPSLSTSIHPSSSHVCSFVVMGVTDPRVRTRKKRHTQSCFSRGTTGAGKLPASPQAQRWVPNSPQPAPPLHPLRALPLCAPRPPREQSTKCSTWPEKRKHARRVLYATPSRIPVFCIVLIPCCCPF